MLSLLSSPLWSPRLERLGDIKGGEREAAFGVCVCMQHQIPHMQEGKIRSCIINALMPTTMGWFCRERKDENKIIHLYDESGSPEQYEPVDSVVFLLHSSLFLRVYVRLVGAFVWRLFCMRSVKSKSSFIFGFFHATAGCSC